jgi:ABC-2 type transport system permease protein
MITRIIKHEWRNLTADRTAWVVLLLFALVIGYALFKGQAWARHQDSTLAQMQQDEQERLGEIRRLIAEEGRKAAAEGKPLTYPAWGPRHPAYVGIWRGQRYAALPPAPLLPLAVGQSDVYPNHFKVSAGMKESFLIAQETESPFKLLAGQFDLAFVILYFYPLLILALTFNLVASEKEDGTLQMLLANRVRLRKIVLGKVAARALVIFLSAIVFSLAGFALTGAGFDGVGAIPRLLLWVCAVTIYGAFWFALSVAINAVGKSAATNAIALAACYLAFVVVIPALVNLGATTFYPVPSRIEFVNAMRAETQEANRKGSQLLGKYFEDHPELAKPQDTKSPFSKTGEDDFAMLSMAKDELVARQMKPLLERFDAQLNHQHQLVNRFRYLSPAILMQSLLYDITGTGVERYQHFLRQVDEYHQSWRRYFSPRVFEKRALASGDLASLPQFQFAEESVGAVIRRASWPGLAMVLLTTLIGYAGLRGYRRFPVVS